ncbi:MAG: DISARM system phospholipase D-like protein DrmC [Phormidesmis sp.]
MASVFQQLSRPAMEGLVDAIANRRLQYPFHPSALANTVPGPLMAAVATELNRLSEQGMRSQHIAYMLQMLAQERGRSQQKRDAIDLVWTGEEILGTESRDTRVVVKELFSHASKSVLISSYALDTGHKAKALFQPLALRMADNPHLQVRLFVNIKRPFGKNYESNTTLTRRFAETFRQDIWPSQPFPEVFYDPRSLSTEKFPRACLHAKCVVIDDEQLLITSANFTEAAHQRNIEAGILLSDAIAAKAIRTQFESLVKRGFLHRLPGLSTA